MDLNEYQLFAERTSRYANQGYSDNRLLMATLGLAGETGEVVDYIKKVIFHSHPMNVELLAREVGDILWYIAEICTAQGLKLDDIATGNIRKLATRYGGEFSSAKSIDRSE